MNLQSAFKVYQKELRDILRDRRTIISMILVPIAIFPILMIGSFLFMRSQEEKIQDKVSKVAWFGPVEADFLKEKVSDIPNIEIFDLTLDSATAVELIQEKALEVMIVVPDDFQRSVDAVTAGDSNAVTPVISMYANLTRRQSEMALEKIMNTFKDYRTEFTVETLTQRGLPPGLVMPFNIVRQNIASAKEIGSFILGSFLPYILILMALTGAMYPAIDLTAGEKERCTLETLLVSGVSRVDIVLGKFFTVFSASIVTATLSVGSLAVTGLLALKTIPEIAQKLEFSLGATEILLMIFAMLPLAAIFSSALMTLSLFAKSYREAQSYISPLMFVVIIPAMASMMPDTEASKELALIPVLNVSMMMKDGLAGTMDPLTTLLTMAVNLILAAGGLYLVVLMFKRESVLFRV